MFFGVGHVGRQMIRGVISGPPTLDLSFGGPTLNPLLTFTRASTATYFDSNGVMQTAATDTPRFDYDPVFRVLNGLLLEESRTNGIVNSGAMALSWTVSDGAIVGASGIVPDGSNTAAFWREGAVNSVHALVCPLVPTASTQYTFSVYAKAGARSLFYGSGLGLGAVGLFPRWNVATGTDATTGSAAGFTHGIQPVGNGWYRCWFTFTTTNTGQLSYNMELSVGGGAYLGDGVSGMYVWGAQGEVGAFPTSYIPTTAAAVTRSPDSCTIQPANMGFFMPPGGSWAAEFIRQNPTVPVSERVVGRIGPVAGATPLFVHTSGALGQYDSITLISGNLSAGQVPQKGATTWAPGNATICLNGGTVVSGAALTTGYSSLSTGVYFLVNAAAPTESMTGYIRRVLYWPRVLSNSDLQQVATMTDPTLDYDFTRMGTLPPVFTFTRASIATYFDATGTMQTVAVDTPRFDYDPVTHAIRGLLCEEARTNLLFPSGDMVSLLLVINSTLTASSGVAPDGTMSMARFSETSTNAVHYTQKANITITASATYTFSIYLKAQENQFIQLFFDDNVNGCYANFDLVAGVVSRAITVRGTGTAIAANITAVGNGVYLCSVTGIAGTATIGRAGIIGIPSGSNSFGPSYQGDPSKGMLVWGAQLEAGAFPLSYIPTTGAAVTRQGDVCDLTPLGAWFSNATTWTTQIEFLTYNLCTTGGGYLRWDDTVGNNVVQFNGNNVAPAFVYGSQATAGANNWNSNQASTTLGQIHRAAIAVVASGNTFAADGAIVAPVGAAVPVPVGLNRIRVGNVGGGVVRCLNGYVRRMRYWPRVLSNSELQQVTS